MKSAFKERQLSDYSATSQRPKRNASTKGLVNMFPLFKSRNVGRYSQRRPAYLTQKRKRKGEWFAFFFLVYPQAVDVASCDLRYSICDSVMITPTTKSKEIPCTAFEL